MPNDDLMTGLGLNEPLNGYSVPVATGVGSQALGPMEASGGVPAGFSGEKYSQDLLDKAKQEYGFIARQNPVVQVGKGEGYAKIESQNAFSVEGQTLFWTCMMPNADLRP